MHRIILTAAASLLTLASSQAEESRWWDVCKPSGNKFSGGRVPEKATAAEAKIIKHVKFEKWKTYEDEFIRFDYPAHELIKLEVKKSLEPFKVEGGVCSTVDNSYQQAYILRVGAATYGVFLLSPAKWLDDGTCFCGPMVHHTYKLDRGTLTRFSMLPGGAVKKAQVVGGGLRFMAFEWTHLACQRPVYERMVASMRLKTRDPGGNDALKKQLIENYGDDGKLGLISRGSTVNELVKNFGEAEKKTDTGLWHWQWKGAEYPMSLVAKIEDGRVVYFPKDGIVRDYAKPYPGTLPWCEQIVKRLPRPKDEDGVIHIEPDDDSEKPKRGPVTEEEKKQVIESLGKVLLQWKSSQNNAPWISALNIASDATESGLTDPAWLKLVADKGSGLWQETHFIRTTAPQAVTAWASKHLSRQASNEGDAQELSEDDLKSLTEVFTESTAEQWQNIAATLWTAKKSSIKRLAFQNLAFQNSLTVEKRVFEALAKGIKHDEGELVYSAMITIPEITIQQPEKLAKSLRKIPEGGEDSNWREIRTDALQHVSQKPKDKLKN